MGQEMNKLMQNYVRYPPSKLRNLQYSDRITISENPRFHWIWE
jgi:hypothetical protein